MRVRRHSIVSEADSLSENLGVHAPEFTQSVVICVVFLEENSYEFCKDTPSEKQNVLKGLSPVWEIAERCKGFKKK